MKTEFARSSDDNSDPLNILLVGCGDIGIPLARRLVDRGARVWGMRRHPEQLPDFIEPIAADITDRGSLDRLADQPWDYLITTLVPAGFSEQGYRRVFVDGMANLLDALAGQPRLKRLIHVSSTSVYHQCGGEWVDEQSPAESNSFSGRALLEAERLLLGSRFAATAVRFAGIYGPGRRRLIDQVRAGEGCPEQPVLYTNRIHRDDCVGVLQHLLELDHRGERIEPLYTGVDSEPVSMWEIKQWLASQLGVTLNPSAPSPSTRRSSKRCSNARLLASGYRLLYPGYRDGYGALLREQPPST